MKGMKPIMSNMRVEKRTNVRNSIMRLFVVIVAVSFQIFWLLNLFGQLRFISPKIGQAINNLAILVALWIYGRDKNISINVPWMALILAFPMFGMGLYFLIGRTSLFNHVKEVYAHIDLFLYRYFHQDWSILEEMASVDIDSAKDTHLIWNCGHFPVYKDTAVTYYPEALDGFNAQIEDMKKAQHFIFIEYHAIEDGYSFGQMKEVLIERAAAGVEVRIFYDDMGSIGFLNKSFIKEMESYGIQCRVFNPIRPWILVFMNNRDHRKITVIDGQIGYTGGYNLAEEYFNRTHPYGYWKDTGIRLEGSAVRSMTLTFLEMWNATNPTHQAMANYLTAKPVPSKGFVQPYADSPLDDEYLGEDVYMSIVNHAKKYVYFVTPYLIITEEMTRVLTLAAKRGVDVRIITPGTPDKQLTYMFTQSFYRDLVRGGVRIFEYIPGFPHAKMCISDDTVATCGTINLDYRSLYLHFENGVYLSHVDCIAKMKKDFDHMFDLSKDVSEDYKGDINMIVRTWRAIVRLIAPLF